MKALERALDWDRHLEATALAAMAVGLALEGRIEVRGITDRRKD